VDDLEAAVSFYEQLTGGAANRFRFAGVELAAVGPFLLFSGSDETAGRFAGVAATLSVPDLDQAIAGAVAAGAVLIAPPQPTPRTDTGLCCAIRTVASTSTSVAS
jgi:predicted enzyme related to lactoylglutathione lyase